MTGRPDSTPPCLTGAAERLTETSGKVAWRGGGPFAPRRHRPSGQRGTTSPTPTLNRADRGGRSGIREGVFREHHQSDGPEGA